jgi:hypothetical protein
MRGVDPCAADTWCTLHNLNLSLDSNPPCARHSADLVLVMVGGVPQPTLLAGVFTVNIGDMMMRWTNFRYSSTIHRLPPYLASPPPHLATSFRVINVSNRDRFSVPFFFNPSLETVIDCIKTCEEDRETQPPVVSKDVLEDFYRRAGFISYQRGPQGVRPSCRVPRTSCTFRHCRRRC